MARGSANQSQVASRRSGAPKTRPLAGRNIHTRNDPTSRATKTGYHRMRRRQRRSSTTWREDAGIDGLERHVRSLNVGEAKPVLANQLLSLDLEPPPPENEGLRQRKIDHPRLQLSAAPAASKPQYVPIWSSRGLSSGVPNITVAHPTLRTAQAPSVVPRPSFGNDMNNSSENQNTWPSLPGKPTITTVPVRPSPWNTALTPNARGSSMDGVRYRMQDADPWALTMSKLHGRFNADTSETRIPTDQLRERSTPHKSGPETSTFELSSSTKSSALQPHPSSLRWPRSIFGDGARSAAVKCWYELWG